MMTTMVPCNDATPMAVEDDARCYSSISNNGYDGAMGCSLPHMPLVRCNAMAWTDETEDGGALLRVLVTRHDPVAGTTVVTERETMPLAPLTGTANEKRYMARKWCERLWRRCSAFRCARTAWP
jgi:hypothetical protein